MYDPEYLASDADMVPEPPKKINLKDIPEPEGDERGKLWEKNHKIIVDAITSTLTKYRASPPGVSELSRITGLSRQTIYEHMRDFSMNPTHIAHTKMFDLMKFDVMMRLCSTALSGNITAMRLYLQIAGVLNPQKKKG